MFRAPSEHSNGNPRLICIRCNHATDVPMHHGMPMQWMLEGRFRKRECLVCSVCGFKVDLPAHCGKPMLYTSTGRLDVRERYGHDDH